MHSSASGATVPMVVRSSSSGARSSALKASRYSSMVFGLAAMDVSLRGPLSAPLASTADNVVPEAAGHMIVDKAGRLHPGVDDDRADELEAALLQRGGHCFRERRFRRDVARAVANWRAACHAPGEGREVLAGGRHRH